MTFLFGRRSIRQFLLVSLILLVSIAGSLTAFFSYHETKEEVEELFDAELAQMARILQSMMAHYLNSPYLDSQTKEQSTSMLQFQPYLSFEKDKALEEAHEQQEYEESLTTKGHKYEKKLAFQVWGASQQTLITSDPSTEWNPETLLPGYWDITVSKRLWRIFVLKDDQSGLTILVGQRRSIRDGMVTEIGVSTLMIPLVLTPLLAILVWVLVGYGLKPVRVISKELKYRDYSNLNAISREGVPSELVILVDSMNALFRRVLNSATREQQFTADAAHELRTPLAGTKIQLQNALRVAESEDTKKFIQQSLKGIDRLTGMVEQLLMLSRLDHQKTLQDKQPLNLTLVCQEVMNEYSNEAADKHIVWDVQCDSGVSVEGNPGAIRILFKNLIENAVRYTNDNSTITVKVQAENVQILDQGPGIPNEELDRVMERFYRAHDVQGMGSGLGLSICQQVAEMHGMQLYLANRDDGIHGLCATVAWGSEAL
ncbi:ATP-binding protein [Litoribrevibacter albus]|uniref:histidine kinase n=1 Tax=Litoribrevibacter albus TaxID=1473156 RepID=A0AA37S8P9_9GAMM|nr:ATP-binding protein [Litoribrevibacter albus]GLQ31140.1 two-component sensor histidine kinase [Litoribrevibacter albus]